MNKQLAWKCLKLVDGQIKSENGNCIWKLHEWKEEPDIKLCNKGFHASQLSIDAIKYVIPDVFALVEYNGSVNEEDDKLVSSRMRIIKAWSWTKPDSLRFSIFCVKQSMKYVDKKKFPEVFKVCVNSIKAIEAVLLNDTEQTRSAAWSAWSAAWSAWSAAWSAWSAADSARSAADSARSAAESARSAAESAAESARSAWSAAESAARSAWSAAESARSAAKKLQHKWLVKYITNHCTPILTDTEGKR